ncbi:hypothetical protein [Kocuria massiliensis]|uniref:hypothetical protein n=1 Tax=Kocuria massiliensis TaxID=1926282 RepID=UPI0022B9999E|nr:hypothetical protein [Kocuria massiliensis]
MTETLVFSMRAMGAVVDVVARPGIPPQLIDSSRASWIDCEPFLPGDTGRQEPHGDVRIVLAPTEAPATEGRVDAAILRVTADDPSLAARDFTSMVTLELIKHQIVKLHLFHAAALMQGETGEVTALIGPSGRGKTTASRTLAGSGWTYLSDETCAIDPATLSVLPYPKPLSVIEHPGAPKAQWAASGIGLNTWRRGKGPEPRLSRLVILDRVDEAPSGQEDGLYPMPLLRGIQILAEQSSGLAQTPHALRGLAELAERVGGIWRVQYRDASQLPGLLAGAGDRDHQEWEYVEAMGATGEAAIAPADDERPAASIVSRNPATSGLLTEEGILLMHADRTVLYTPVGADLWLEAGGGITREDLRQRLEDIYGPAPEGAFEAALAAAVDDGGVLESVRGPRDGTEDTPPRDEPHPASGAEEAAS